MKWIIIICFLVQNLIFKYIFFQKQEQKEDLALLFIEQGDIELLYDAKGNKEKSSEINLKNLKRGEVLGDFSFFTDSPYEETARSRTFSTVYPLFRSEFMEILKEYPEDYVFHS